FLIYPSRRHLAPRTRVVIDFLVEHVKRTAACMEAGPGLYPCQHAGRIQSGRPSPHSEGALPLRKFAGLRSRSTATRGSEAAD
ncbi:MAG TPA: hypothetical protein VHY76_14150, partial [Acetobacteraceae bacterium]|nr:hypothetical protein [Acetobacteraceae bacterium]